MVLKVNGIYWYVIISRGIGFFQECLGCWEFKSKRQQSEQNSDGLCRAYMFPLFVTEEFETWPEQHARERHWVSIAVFLS